MKDNSRILSLKNINKSFSGVKVLNDISLDFYGGEIHCIVGENGAGKSTLIKIISGAYIADSGEILYLDKKINNNNPRWARDHGINAIYQEIDLVKSLNAAENIFLGNESLNKLGIVDRKDIYNRSKEILATMEVDFNLKIPVYGLTLAQQQMVAIAKALSLNTKLFIFDEPTAVFTTKEIEILFRVINKLKNQNKAILYISHHLDEIFQIGDKITILRDGNHIKTDIVSKFSKQSVINQMVGRKIDLSKRDYSPNHGKKLLEVMDLSKNGVLAKVSFFVKQGEILGVAGLVGAGRSEMVRTLVGIDKKDSGKISYKGKLVEIKSIKNALKLGIAILPEDRKTEGIIESRSIGENITYCNISKKYAFYIPWRKISRLVSRLIENVGVRPPKRKMDVKFLSGGNQQKVVLGKLIGSRSDLLILDEPTRGVDVGAREEIYKLMDEMKDEKKAIIMVSSDLEEILFKSDRILVMSKGKIVAEVDAKDATEELILSHALAVGGEKIEK